MLSIESTDLWKSPFFLGIPHDVGRYDVVLTVVHCARKNDCTVCMPRLLSEILYHLSMNELCK